MLFLGLFSNNAEAKEKKLDLLYAVTSGPIPLGSTTLTIYDTAGDGYRIQQNKNINIPGFYIEESVSVAEGSIVNSILLPQKFHQSRRSKRQTTTTSIQWQEGVPVVTIEPPIEIPNLNSNDTFSSIDPTSTMYQVMLLLNQKQSCDVQFKSFDGVSTAVVSVSQIGFRNLNNSIYKGEALGCELKMKATSGLAFREKNPSLSTMQIWFAQPSSLQQQVPVLITVAHKSWGLSMHLQEIALSP